MSGMEGLDPKLLAEMSPMEFGKFLRDIREKRGLRQHEVAARARVHPSYISHLEAGNKDLRKARPQIAIPILRAYGLSEELIMEVIKHWSEPFREMAKRLEVTNVLAENEVRLTPLHLPVVEAGAGSPAWDDVRETLTLYLPELRGKENRVFGVRIVGDSMEPLLYEGDIAIVWTEGAYGPGTIVAIGIPGNGIAVKQLYYGPKGEAIMHSLNPRYADEPVPEGSKIWGPVIQVVRSLPNGKPGHHLTR